MTMKADIRIPMLCKCVGFAGPADKRQSSPESRIVVLGVTKDPRR